MAALKRLCAKRIKFSERDYTLRLCHTYISDIERAKLEIKWSHAVKSIEQSKLELVLSLSLKRKKTQRKKDEFSRKRVVLRLTKVPSFNPSFGARLADIVGSVNEAVIARCRAWKNKRFAASSFVAREGCIISWMCLPEPAKKPLRIHRGR